MALDNGIKLKDLNSKSGDRNVVETGDYAWVKTLYTYGFLKNVVNTFQDILLKKKQDSKTFIHQVLPAEKCLKDKLTFMPCSNISGTHKFELFVMGRYKNPRAFKNVSQLLVKYKQDNKVWMTREPFSECR